MSLKLYRQRDADLNAEILKAKKARAAIGDTAVAEKRALTDDERAKFVAGGQQIEQLEADLADNAPLLAAAEAANEAERAYRAPAPAAELGDPTVATPRVEMPDMTQKAGFFGRQLQAVRNFAANGGWSHIGAEDKAVLKPMMAAATGATTDVPSDGGFLIAPQRSATILQRAYSSGQILSRVNRQPIGPGSNGMKFPVIDESSRADNSRYGGVVSGWLGQGNTLTSGKPKFRELELKLRKVGAFVYATDEMLVDAVAFEGWVNRYLPLELAFRVENAILNGTGSNQPIGVLNSGAVITFTRSTASHVIADDLRGAWARLFAPCRTNAAWFVDQSVEPEFDKLSIAIGTGGALDPSYKAAGSVPGQQYATYKGAPIIPVEHCAALGTSGDLILVDLSEYTVIDKGGVDQAVSLHVAFLTDEQVFRFLYRVDGQLNWNTTLAPKSGGNSLSCAVVLS